jgi:hypothetical protein|eukprot:SAG25_NODE_393_length_8567_cov_15.363368_4_plen_146_part_00
MLVPSIMGYFLTYLVQPFVDLFEQVRYHRRSQAVVMHWPALLLRRPQRLMISTATYQVGALGLSGVSAMQRPTVCCGRICCSDEQSFAAQVQPEGGFACGSCFRKCECCNAHSAGRLALDRSTSGVCGCLNACKDMIQVRMLGHE